MNNDSELGSVPYRPIPAVQIIALAALLVLAGCSSTPKRDTLEQASSAASSSVSKRGGGYYLDDGPGDNPPSNLAALPDATPRDEPLRKANMRPYVALGKSYTPMTVLESYKERGIASWYGRRYHGQKTASGEIYNMYAMTAAHPILPLPSYVRVTNIKNGKSVVVRVNDRGPFHSDRLIDLSYTAAYKLGVLGGGSAQVEVESILPGREPAMQIAAAPPAAANVPATVADNASGIYLQLGAFSVYDNADNFLTRMRAELSAVADTLGISAKDGLFRVHVGPYADQTLAQQAADKIAQSLAIKPVLLVR
ncbi:MAG: septal ring lytic transglycosylase RlpA family protein [Nitrosomonadales bacterium]|nr:MAG: septal ring lytic transglycosylase RlpA family protein [Nitrosomonadales bacterium]